MICLVLGLGLFLGGQVPAATIDNFDPPNGAVTATQSGSAPGPLVTAGGPTGQFLRLINDGANSQGNHYSYNLTDPGAFANVSATFDFAGFSGDQPADGWSMTLVPTSGYGNSGMGPNASESANFAGTLGVGFRNYPGGTNNVALHWDGQELLQRGIDMGQVSFRSGTWNQAQISVQQMGAGSNVKVQLIGDVHGAPTAPVTAVNQYVFGLLPYENRVQFSGRTGGANMTVDLDNVNVQYNNAYAAPPTLSPAAGTTLQDFDSLGTTPFVTTQWDTTPGPLAVGGGATGNFMRLVNQGVGGQNGVIAFDRTAAGIYSHVEADWDLSVLTGADGGAFMLLNTGIYGASGAGPNPIAWEEPNLAQTFAVGFDVYDNISDISLHWDGAQRAQVGTYDYRGGTMKSAHTVIDYVAGGANVSLTMDGTPIFTNEFIVGMIPYEGRVAFGARTGGVTTNFDVDNVNVQWSSLIPEPTDPFHWRGFTGNYTDNTKWTNDILPGPADHAVIGLGASNSSNLNLAGTGSLTVEGSGLLNNSGTIRVGNAGTAGTLNQTDGVVQASGDFYVADGGSSGSTYTITGGTLNVNGTHTVIGRGGVGHVVQSGNSTVNVQRLFLAESGGSAGSTYTMNGGTLNVNFNGGEPPYALEIGRTDAATFTLNDGTINVNNGQRLVVGQGAAGVLNQNGGTINASDRIHLGETANATGTLNMTDGRINVAGYLILGSSGTGIINQSGGTINQTGARVILGDQANSQGTYNLSGDAVLNAVALTMGDKAGTVATVTQTSGVVTVAGRLAMSANGTATSTYALSGDGVLNVGGDYFLVGQAGEGTFVQSGSSTVNANLGTEFIVGDWGGAVGQYEMSGGTLNVNNGRTLFVGKNGMGTFSQTGGIVSASGRLHVAGGGASNSSYLLQDGIVNVGQHLVIGDSGTGLFEQTGGTVNVLNGGMGLYIGDQSSSTGTYRISGGALNVNAIRRGGHAGNTSTLHIQGAAATINTVNEYNVNDANATIIAEIANAGISPVQVGTNATVGGSVDVDLYGGVAFTEGKTFDLIIATNGVSGSVTQIDPEAGIDWDVTNTGNTLQATMTGPGQATIVPGYGGALTHVSVNGGAGAAEDYITINGIRADEPLYVLMAVEDDQGQLGDTELDALAGYIASGGQPVTVIADDPFFAALLGNTIYDLAFNYQPAGIGSGYFAWDLTDYDAASDGVSGLVVTDLAVGVPEPSTLVLAVLAMLGLVAVARRRRK